MLKHLSPASWTLIFMLLILSLYIQAQKISKSYHAKPIVPVGASLLHGR